MRLEEWIGMKGILNLPQDIPNYNAPLTRQEEQQFVGQSDIDGLQRKRFEILNKVKKEMALDFMLVNKLHYLQRNDDIFESWKALAQGQWRKICRCLRPQR